MVLNLSNIFQVQQRPNVVVGAEKSQASCWQKATPKVSLFCCFEKFRTVQYELILFFIYKSLNTPLKKNEINELYK